MSSITTYIGKDFDPINPDKNLLEILDIAHSLSLICRCNGHVKYFYSVAQHCLACAIEAEKRGLSRRIILGCLLHDASEAYLSDVTRPIKKELDFYLSVEDNLQNIIWEHFIGSGLTKKEKDIIFEIDDEMLSLEFIKLMPKKINEEYKKIISNVKCEFEMMDIVRDKFINFYEKYR